MKKIVLLLSVITIMLYCSGCDNSKIDLKETESNTRGIESNASNPFEGNNETEILGTLFHSPTEVRTDENANVLPFEYNGGEFELKYEVKAKGKAKNLGFLIFVDGVAQPYKTDAESDFKYMNYFELENDNEPLALTFKFIPVTGKKGDTIPLNVVSIYNAQFMPDLKKTSGYGGYHSELSSILQLHYNSDAPSVIPKEYPQNKIISTIENRKDNITEDFLKIESQKYMGETINEELDTNVFNTTYYNNKKEISKIAYSKEKPLKVKYCLYGAPGIEYKTTFFINHQPISKDEIISHKTTLEKGMLSIIEFDIDVSKLDKLNTFYIISVPTNHDEYPTIRGIISKTPSILIYEEE